MLVIHEQFLSVAFFTANSNFAEGDGDNTPMLLQSRVENFSAFSTSLC